MPRVDKSARVIATVEAIRKRKFTDYTKTTKYYSYNVVYQYATHFSTINISTNSLNKFTLFYM
jgi:uncharacterized protein YcfJ